MREKDSNRGFRSRGESPIKRDPNIISGLHKDDGNLKSVQIAVNLNCNQDQEDGHSESHNYGRDKRSKCNTFCCSDETE